MATSCTSEPTPIALSGIITGGELVSGSLRGIMRVIEGTLQSTRKSPTRWFLGRASCLSAERVILNFLQRMSGVATHTQRYVRRTAGTGAKVYDTPQDHSGPPAARQIRRPLRRRINHRIGLFDGLLVKDNHVAAVHIKELGAHLSRVVTTCRAEDPSRVVEIEVDTLEQLREVIKVEGINVILLDNMDCPKMEMAVEIRNKAGKKGTVDLEASGGVTLETIRRIAETGVDRIAVGTHALGAGA